MNVSKQNGNSVVCSRGEVIINDEKINIPKGMNTNSLIIINGKVYIGGYEYFPKEKKFKRTLKAFWESLF